MIILNKGQENELVLNINNNSRIDFTGYTLTFTHILSQEVKSYNIPAVPPLFAENDRYCEIQLDLASNDLNYEGEYTLQIYGNGTTLVYTNLARLNGTQETPSFTEFISSNEENENYIFIS